jgi:hypothetical protein
MERSHPLVLVNAFVLVLKWYVLLATAYICSWTVPSAAGEVAALLGTSVDAFAFASPAFEFLAHQQPVFCSWFYFCSSNSFAFTKNKFLATLAPLTLVHMDATSSERMTRHKFVYSFYQAI